MATDSPYSPPTASPSAALLLRSELGKKLKSWYRSIWVSLTLILITPALGLGGTIFSMNRAFAALGSSGIGDPAALGAVIGEALIAAVVGLLFVVPGLVLLVIAIVRFRFYRAKLRNLPP